MTPDQLPPRFAAKVRVDDAGCWIFTASTNSRGYGLIAIDGDGTTRLAHRAAYEQLVGPIPDGLTIDHLCMVKRCCNPEHLEPVTSGDNTRRAVAAGLAYPALAARNAAKVACYRGHPFDDVNTYIDHRGHRACRECRRRNDRRAQAKRTARRNQATS